MKRSMRFLQDLFDEFIEEYYVKYTKDHNYRNNQVIHEKTTFEDDLEFDWEALDYFIGEVSDRFNVDLDGFYPNTHTRAMSYELVRIPTILTMPIVGIRKWMAFPKDRRISLCMQHIIDAMESGKLDSLHIYENSAKSNEQLKVFNYLKKNSVRD